MTTAPSGILEARRVTKRFGGLKALEDVSVSAREREILGIIGPNGAGKTTLFNVICGIFPPDGGEVFLRGRRLRGLRPSARARRGLGRTFQIVRPFNELTLLENILVAYGSRYDGRFASLGSHRRRKITALGRAFLKEVGLEAHAQMAARALPIAFQRKLEIGRCLALDPAVMLLDEPAAGLVHQEAVELMDLIRRLRDRGITILIVEHNMEVAMNVCDRIVVLDHGVLIGEGSPAEIRRNPRVIEAYLGTEGT